MNCPKCQRPLPKNSKFCNFCGATISASESEGPNQGKVHVGDMFDGKWRIESKLGQGGMGAVFLAHDVSLDREVAIKILAASLCNDMEFVERFEREAKLTAKFEHPNIVPIYAVGRFGSRPFIVMKLLDGVPLTKIIKNAPSGLPVPQILSLMKQLCDGLGFIHAKGFVHRDIKSANIQVSDQGLATILDFGIIKDTNDTHSKTRAGTLMGTPHYMSPEQATGKPADARADLYALGCIAFEMFTGHLPFTKGNDFAIIAAQVKTPPPDVCADRKDVPAEVGVVVKKMLAKSPADRYQTASELYEALEKAVTPPAAAAAPAPEPKAKPQQSSKPSSQSVAVHKTPPPEKKPSKPQMAASVQRRNSAAESPRKNSSSRNAARSESSHAVPSVPPPQPGVAQPLPPPRSSSKVELRERPSSRRRREELERSKTSPVTILATLFLVALLFTVLSCVGIFYAWGKMPEMVPPALMNILETQVRPVVRNIPKLAVHLPPDPAEQNEQAADEAANDSADDKKAQQADASSDEIDADEPNPPEQSDTSHRKRSGRTSRRQAAAQQPKAEAPKAEAPKEEPPKAEPPKQETAQAPAEPPPAVCREGGTGTLRILSKPVWGRATVDGSEWGSTPVTKKIKAGTHVVKVFRGGYANAEEKICVAEGEEPTIVNIKLEKSP